MILPSHLWYQTKCDFCWSVHVVNECVGIRVILPIYDLLKPLGIDRGWNHGMSMCEWENLCSFRLVSSRRTIWILCCCSFCDGFWVSDQNKTKHLFGMWFLSEDMLTTVWCDCGFFWLVCGVCVPYGATCILLRCLMVRLNCCYCELHKKGSITVVSFQSAVDDMPVTLNKNNFDIEHSWGIGHSVS